MARGSPPSPPPRMTTSWSRAPTKGEVASSSPRIPRTGRRHVCHGSRLVLLREPLLALGCLQLLYSGESLLIYVCDFLVDCLPDEVAELVSDGAGESADNFVEGGWGGRFT